MTIMMMTNDNDYFKKPKYLLNFYIPCNPLQSLMKNSIQVCLSSIFKGLELDGYFILEMRKVPI